MKYWQFDRFTKVLVSIEPEERPDDFEAPLTYVTVEPDLQQYASLKPHESLFFNVDNNTWYVDCLFSNFQWYSKETCEGPFLINEEHYRSGNFTIQKPTSVFDVFNAAADKWEYSQEKEYMYNLNKCMDKRATAYKETDALRLGLEYDAIKQDKAIDLTAWVKEVDQVKLNFPKPIFGQRDTYVYSRLEGIAS